MSKKRILLTFFSFAILFQGFYALAQEARARYELLNLIRKEKFDKILPGAMRDNNDDIGCIEYFWNIFSVQLDFMDYNFHEGIDASQNFR